MVIKEYPQVFDDIYTTDYRFVAFRHYFIVTDTLVGYSENKSYPYDTYRSIYKHAKLVFKIVLEPV
jgi:hypothetical protein